MNFDPTIPLWGLILFAISILSGGYTWFATRRKDVDAKFASQREATEARFNQGTRRMDELTRRVDALETSVRQMPGKEDLHKMELQLERMTGHLGKMQAVMEGNQNIMERLEGIVGRHEDHLLGGSK